MTTLDSVQAEMLALMAEHSLVAQGWKFKFSRQKTSFGMCSYRDKTLTLSAPWAELRPRELTRQTMLHEVAHALTPGDKHGRRWQAKARELGIVPAACVESGVEAELPSRYQGRCVNNHVIPVHRRPRRVASCTQCSPHFNPKFLITWWEGDGLAEMGEQYQAELARIKTKYNVC